MTKSDLEHALAIEQAIIDRITSQSLPPLNLCDEVWRVTSGRIRALQALIEEMDINGS